MLTIGTVLIYMLRIISRETKSKFQLTIGVFFYHVCDVGEWEIYIIAKYADDAIRIDV